MNKISDYVLEDPDGFTECALCSEIANSEEQIRRHVKNEHLDHKQTIQRTINEVQKA